MACSGWKRDDPSLSASPCKRPIRRICSDCWARAASGHAAAVPKLRGLPAIDTQCERQARVRMRIMKVS